MRNYILLTVCVLTCSCAINCRIEVENLPTLIPCEDDPEVRPVDCPLNTENSFACYMVSCDEMCVNTMVNPQHCGQCYNRCHDNEVCEAGECQACPDETPYRCHLHYAPFDPDYTDRTRLEPFICTDLAIDPWNCGSCGNECLYSTECVEGFCI